MLEPTYKEEITVKPKSVKSIRFLRSDWWWWDGHWWCHPPILVCGSFCDGVVIYDGKLASLRRFKDDVKEVKQGFELGLRIEDYNDIKVNDVIEAYVMKEVPVE